MTWFEELTKRIGAMSNTQPEKTMMDNLETPQQYKERWRSIYIIYFTMFLISLGFSIIVTGVWPYLDKLDPTAGKEFMGFVVAANPFGQMIFSPLVGWWSNRLGSIRIPLIASLIVFTFASGMYSSLELFASYRKHWMLWSRFLVGVSSANIAACRAYLSAATRYSERTKAISMISLAQVLGFIIGPAIQAVVVPLGDEGFWIIEGSLKLNMYTASGWINVFLSLVNIYLFFPSVFKERKIAAKEAMLKMGKDNVKEMWQEEKVNYFSVWSMLVAFFVIVFNFMLLETLGTPMTMDQFAWSKSESLWYMGILMSVGAIVAIITFATIAPLSKRFSEVRTMIWGGFFFMVLGRVSFIPFGEVYPKMYDSDLKLNLTLYCDSVLKYRNCNTSFDFGRLNETLQEYDRWFDENEANKSVINLPVALSEYPTTSVAMRPVSNKLAAQSLRSDAVFEFIIDQVKEDPNKAKSVGGVFLYNITKDKKQVKQWTMDLKNAKVYEGKPEGKPNTTLTIEDDDFILMAEGKLNPQTAFMKGKLKVAGNIMLAQKLAPLLKTNAKL